MTAEDVAREAGAEAAEMMHLEGEDPAQVEEWADAWWHQHGVPSLECSDVPLSEAAEQTFKAAFVEAIASRL